MAFLKATKCNKSHDQQNKSPFPVPEKPTLTSPIKKEKQNAFDNFYFSQVRKFSPFHKIAQRLIDISFILALKFSLFPDNNKYLVHDLCSSDVWP